MLGGKREHLSARRRVIEHEAHDISIRIALVRSEGLEGLVDSVFGGMGGYRHEAGVDPGPIPPSL